MEEKKETGENFAELFAQQEMETNRLQTGQKISGKVIAISGDSVFVDLGGKQDGILDRSEILDADGNETVQPGDLIEGRVVSLSPQGIRLSRSMLGHGLEALEDAKASGIPVKGKIRGACKGGYQVDVLGKTAFCPGSQMENLPGVEPGAMAGREMDFLITRLENNGRNIVVSRRALIEKERKENLDKLLQTINVNDIVEGTVTRLAPFGAFVELAPGVEGLAHISELSWSHVQSPDELLSVGDKVRVKITGIGQDDKGRISLSLKQAEGNPWDDIDTRISVGDTITGKVRRLAPFGAFVEILPGIEGLVHLSEFSWEKRITKPEEVVAPGDTVSVKIKELNKDGRRISLSIRDAQGDPWENLDEKFVSGAKLSGTVANSGPHGLFVTLAPGITGLIGKNALASGPRLTNLSAGSPIEVQIRSIDPAARRIALAPVVAEVMDEPAEKEWRPQMQKDRKDFGIMADALQKALKKDHKS